MSNRTRKHYRYYWFCLILLSYTQVLPIKAETVELEMIHPFDRTAFVQGLEVNDDNQLIVSTGLYGQSIIGEVDPLSGQIKVMDTLNHRYFGEGITFTPKYLWQLTWQENTVFKRNANTLEIIDKIPMDEEGWGLAYDNDRDVLWHSDGTNKLYQRDPENFHKIDTLTITEHGEPIDLLNELEYVNGAIYANIWYSTDIVRINSETGEVVNRFKFEPLLKSTMTSDELDAIDSLNGIAHIKDNRFYITGKLYPYLYEVSLYP